MHVKRIIGRIRRKAKMMCIIMREQISTMIYSCNDDVKAEILVLSHSLEKGMGINNNKEIFGVLKASNLLSLMEEYPSVEDYEYRVGCAVLEAYIKHQKNNGIDVTPIEKRYSSLRCDSDWLGGVIKVDRNRLLEATKFDFERFIKLRHSIRDFSNEKVKREEIVQAVNIAQYCPSACNRQPCKFYFSLNDEINNKIGYMLMGNKGFEERIPYYGIITSSKGMFGWHEPYQWYINGGIFMANLVLSMHSLGIGSCIFQWPDFSQNDKALRSIMGLKNSSEAIIAVVGFGKYSEVTKCLRSLRRPISDVLVELM